MKKRVKGILAIVAKWTGFKWAADFLKKYGIDALLALLIFNFPMYAVAFIPDPGFQTFALGWTAFWWGLGALTPGWLVTILLALFIRWLRGWLVQAYLDVKEAFRKLQLQNQLSVYLTSEEIDMILEMAKKVEFQSEGKRKEFREKLRKERLQMIDDQWTKEANKG
jgi:virulence-associated protein VapD